MTNPLELAEIKQRYPKVAAGKGLPRFARESFLKVLLNPFNLGFAVAMPIFMYLMFGVGQDYSHEVVGNGNVAASILTSMTYFGVLLTTASFAAGVGLERAQGTSRLYAVSPLSASAQLMGRILGILGVALVVIAVTFTVGVFTGAQMTFSAWVFTAVMVLVVSIVGVTCGFGCGFLTRSDGAFAATSAILVLSSFGAGIFVPLDQMGPFFHALAPWTPLWGASQLVEIPIMGTNGFPLAATASFLFWSGVFSLLALWGLKRDTAR